MRDAIRAEEIETPESKGLSCKTVVSTKRSLEAASVYARDGKKVVVLKRVGNGRNMERRR